MNHLLDFFAMLFGIRTANNSEGSWPDPATRIKPLLSLLKAILFLLVVITILFFLISLVTESYFKERNTTKKLNSLSALIHKYQHEHSTLPASLEQVVMNDPIKRNLMFDSWGSMIQYKSHKEKQAFILYSAGKDRKLNTNDDIVQIQESQR